MYMDDETGNIKYKKYTSSLLSTCFFLYLAAACGDLAFSFETDTRNKNLVSDTSSRNFLFYYFQELFFFNRK